MIHLKWISFKYKKISVPLLALSLWLNNKENILKNENVDESLSVKEFPVGSIILLQRIKTKVKKELNIILW